MVTSQLVVPVADNQQNGNAVASSRQQPNNVECRLVGPVDILEHENRRRTPFKGVDKRGRDLVGSRLAPRDLGELTADLLEHAERRPERARREERVTRPPDDAHRAAELVAEAL